MKFIASIFAALVVALGVGGNAYANPEDCAESDTRPDDVECVVDEDGNYPIVLPTIGTVPDTTTPPPTTPPPTGGLPATGTDSTTLALQMGGVLLVGGLVVLVAARRRSPAAD